MDWDSVHFLMVLLILGAIAYLNYELENPWSKFLIGVTVFFSVVGITGIYRSPTVKAIIVDSETQQPIKGALIHVGWHKIYAGPGGQWSGKTVKEMRINAGDDGSFKIPAQYLINCVPFPFGQWGSFGVVVHAHGYKMAHIDKGHMPQSGYVPLERIVDPARFEWKIMGLRDAAGEQYLKDEIRNYLDRFGNKRWGKDVQEDIASRYLEIGDYASALKKYEELASDFPEERWYADRIRECRIRAQSINSPIVVEDLQGLTDKLHSADVQARRDASNTLIGKLQQNSIDALSGALHDPDVEVRMNAVAALGNIAEKQAYDALLISLKDSSSIVRELSARYIGLSRDPLYVPALNMAKDDKDRNVQDAVIRALGRIAHSSVK